MGAYMVGMIGAGALKDNALTLTSAIKYTYSQAVVNNSRYRLVFDLEQNTYHAELVHSAITPERQVDEEDEDLLTDEARALAEEKEREDDLFDDDEDNPFGVNRRVSYERVQDGIIKPGKFTDGVRVVSVKLATGDVIDQGQAAINFFPNGFQEPVLVTLEDPNEARFWLLTEPLTGRVRLFSDELDVPREFGQGEDDD